MTDVSFESFSSCHSRIDITVWKMAFPECPPAGAPYLAKSLTFNPPQQPSNTQAASSNRICLAWNESPSPECLRPFLNFDHIWIHTNTADKSIRQFFAPIGRNALANLKARTNYFRDPTYMGGQ